MKVGEGDGGKEKWKQRDMGKEKENVQSGGILSRSRRISLLTRRFGMG